MMYIWLALVIVFVVAECLTVGLVSIWFAGGALVSMFAAMAGAGTVAQIVLFLLVSGMLLAGTRPFVKKYLMNKKIKTNYESVIGEVAKVTEVIDNYNQTGAAFAGGKEWTARSANNDIVIAKDSLVRVIAVEGVKLIVEVYETENREASLTEENK